jgi:hypothetical protein
MNELIANAILLGLVQQNETGDGYVSTDRQLEEVTIDGTFDLVELSDYIIDVLKANAS